MRSIYKSLSPEQYSRLKNELDGIAERFNELIVKHGFNRVIDSKGIDALILSYNMKDNQYTINIGLSYNDDNASFDLFILKGFDLKRKRYYKRIILDENLSIDYLKQSWGDIFKRGVDIASSYTKEDLTDFVKIN
jgi:hypothetical protein